MLGLHAVPGLAVAQSPVTSGFAPEVSSSPENHVIEVRSRFFRDGVKFMRGRPAGRTTPCA
jgi:hypothetical protein